MSSSESRIGVLVSVFLLVVLVVIGHLFFVMVVDHDVWLERSHRNRWAFRSVPSMRGAILDRFGKVLAHDEPTMEVSLYYLRFRLRHPVGAAVHGATVWARTQPGRELTTYSYRQRAHGPSDAARDLLAVPVKVLRRGVLERRTARELATTLTTLISGSSGMSRRKVFTALRTAAEETPEIRCGDAIEGFPEADLLAEFERILASLRHFEAELEVARESGARGFGLIKRLEWARRHSLGQHTMGGSEKIETMEWPIAEHVPFALAAPLQVGRLAHPGITVRPGVRRIMADAEKTSLRKLLGGVKRIGRNEPDEQWIDRRMQREMPDRWLEDIVPEGAAPSSEDRARMQASARASLKRLTRRYERRGSSAIEQAYDDDLSGRLGMRLVERDSKQREHLMWGNLRVKSGHDITITIDSDLQYLVEQAVVAGREGMAALHEAQPNRDKCKASFAVIDAQSGDVLAFAGSPVGDASWERAVPGVTWGTNGSLGSVVKPFVLVEQLVSRALGHPHTPMAAIEACSGKFVFGGVELHCEGHWDEGKEPVMALAKSCNQFFYQVAKGLGQAGIDRALQRFGLAPSGPGSEFEPCWQGRVPGFLWTAPRMDRKTLLPRRAIGYDVEASPLAVARAYAGIATGRLPTLGLLHGSPRPAVSLAGIEAELAVVRRGLATCVQSGTARHVESLSRFQVLGKTGTAQIGTTEGRENNGWFAGYLPWTSRGSVQLCFAAVIYWVPDGNHGGEVAGSMVADLLESVQAHPLLRDRYITPWRGR